MICIICCFINIFLDILWWPFAWLVWPLQICILQAVSAILVPDALREWSEK